MSHSCSSPRVLCRCVSRIHHRDQRYNVISNAIVTSVTQVYATDGDETLGGSDLDLCLCDFLEQQVLSLV